MKSYFSCIDTAFVKYIPQPLQHIIVADKAAKLGGKVTFYTSEDFETLDNHGVIKSRIEAGLQNADGIIFFTLRQFFNNGKLNVDFIRFILDHGYEVHFARENLSISNKEALNELFPILYATQYVQQRDEPRSAYWKQIWDKLPKLIDWGIQKS